jgi:glycosyltransferase involved in cell wall biosynthesis
MASCDRSRTFVVIPSYNEGEVVVETVRQLLPLGYSIVVVDDGSTQPVESLEELPVHCVRHPVNLGQGAALQTGMDYALSHGATYIVHFDADGQHPADRIATFLAELEHGDCDVVVGSRFLRPSDQSLIPGPRRLLLKAAVTVSGLLTGIWLSDAHNGFRAMTADAARRIRLHENGFAHATEFLDECRRAKLRLRELPTPIRYTAYSMAKGQSSTNSINILIDILLRKAF